MLNTTKVLKYVKTNLGFPFQTIEITDDDILEYIQDYTIEEFSKYIPDVNKISFDLTAVSRVSGSLNEYLIEEEDGLEILSVKNVYFNCGGLLTVGHPIMGAFNQRDLREFVLNVETSMMVYQSSMFMYTYEFKHPNIIRISPTNFGTEGSIILEYERVHPSDLSTIPNEHQLIFEQMCLADIMIVLGRIRKKYGDGVLKTPFGEIPLNSQIYEEGIEKKREIIEKLQQLTYPNVTIAFG
jgi:hypothetical protein